MPVIIDVILTDFVYTPMGYPIPRQQRFGFNALILSDR